MCNLCDDGDMEVCSACGREVCGDVTSGDDVVRPAYVTSGGNLYCDECGPQFDVGAGPEVDCNPELLDAGEELLEGWGEFVDLSVYQPPESDPT